MATKTVTDQSFASDVLGAEGPVLVDFWAEWCGPCRMIAPALEEIANDLGDKVTIAKLNIDENPETPGRYGVRGIPTMLLFKGGQPIAQKVGAAPRSQIQQWLESNLDVSVRSRARADHSGRLGPFEPARIRPELLVPRQIVVWLEPADPCFPRRCESRERSLPARPASTTLKSTVSGWWSTFIRKGVPHSPQNSRWPKLDERTDCTLSAPSVQTRSPSRHARERPSPARRCSAGRCGNGTSRSRTARS